MGNCIPILHYNVPVDKGVTIDEIVRVKGCSRDAVCRYPRVIAAPAEPLLVRIHVRIESGSIAPVARSVPRRFGIRVVALLFHAV